jgi:thiosulfate dehydrogenase
MIRPTSLLLALALLGSGCGDRDVPAAELGQDRFSDPRVSTSHFNTFTCATCHVVDAAAKVVPEGRFDPGYNLAGAATRSSWWGGGETTLLSAINVCIKQFMGGRALTRDEVAARELDAYLEAHPTTDTAPASFTIERMVGPLADIKGEATRGADVYQKSCYRCHGEAHSAKGRSSTIASIIPEASISSFHELARDVTVEKIRHGRFFNVGGLMPFYTKEAMTDQTIADILAYLGL